MIIGQHLSHSLLSETAFSFVNYLEPSDDDFKVAKYLYSVNPSIFQILLF